MSAPKWTPGPWTWTQSALHPRIAHVWSTDNWRCIADVWNAPGTEGAEAAANARLMAVAPKLAEACERAERKLSAYVGVCSGDKELTEAILPMLRAALAEAKGEA